LEENERKKEKLKE